MADAYGKLLLSTSDDCSFDQALLLKKLNSYKWAYDDTQWCADERSACIVTDPFSSQYPTVFPNQIKRWLIELDDGTEEWIQCRETELDYSEIIEIETEECDDLDALCADIAEAISTGWIEIGLVANTGSRDAYFQTLQINSNGQGVRRYCLTGYPFPEGMQLEYTKNFQSS